MSHTYATLEVSAAAHTEIADKLRAAGYGHAFDGAAIDMHGIGLAALSAPEGASQPEPVMFVSPKQLTKVRDPEDDSGLYLPTRKTARGNFTMPLYAAPQAGANHPEPTDTHAFKNFHLQLCNRFGYTHDPIHWRRDQASLIEHIAASPGTWRCFHCSESFTDRAAAQEHFGPSEHDKPICQMDPGYIRWLIEQHRRNVDEDSEALRTVRSLAGEHEALRRRAEELGYARGLADAQKHPEDLGLCSAAPAAPARLIGWRTSDYLMETADPAMAKNWEPHHTMLPIFEGDANTKLVAPPVDPGPICGNCDTAISKGGCAGLFKDEPQCQWQLPKAKS